MIAMKLALAFFAINNSLNEVRRGFRIPPAEWGSWFDITIHEVEFTYRKWLALKQTYDVNR
jgi:hypothetical protein